MDLVRLLFWGAYAILPPRKIEPFLWAVTTLTLIAIGILVALFPRGLEGNDRFALLYASCALYVVMGLLFFASERIKRVAMTPPPTSSDE